jgi:hypothetical protein
LNIGSDDKNWACIRGKFKALGFRYLGTGTYIRAGIMEKTMYD